MLRRPRQAWAPRSGHRVLAGRGGGKRPCWEPAPSSRESQSLPNPKVFGHSDLEHSDRRFWTTANRPSHSGPPVQQSAVVYSQDHRARRYLLWIAAAIRRLLSNRTLQPNETEFPRTYPWRWP